MEEKGWIPWLAVPATLLLAIPFLLWSHASGGWLPGLVFSAIVGTAGWRLHERLGTQVTAAFIVTAAVALAWMLPVGRILVSPPSQIAQLVFGA